MFEMTDCYYPDREGSVPDFLMAAWMGDQVVITFGRKFLILPAPDALTRGPGGPDSLRIVESPDGEYSYYASVKYRYGRFYRKTESSVCVWDRDKGDWNPVLRSGKGFSDFDITSDGRVLLLCPGEFQPEHFGCSGMDMIFNAYRPGSVRLLEVHEAGVGMPGGHVDVYLPEELKCTVQAVDYLPVFDRLIPFSDRFVLVNSFLGLVYLFDAERGALSKVDVPWPALDLSFLAAQQGLVSTLKGQGRVKVSRGCFPFSITIYPRDRSCATVLVKLPNHFKPGTGRWMDEQARLRGDRYAPLPREFTTAELEAGEGIGIYDLDLDRRCIRPSHLGKPLDALDQVLPRSLWLDPHGRWIDLASLPALRSEKALVCPGQARE